ncbi:pyruvate kinase [candidate division KSB1 bacterium]|nr:pyruvate kinase [candidate division KSB1 bacterium]
MFDAPKHIIVTLGPAVSAQIPALIQAGATGFRLNCSHLSQTDLVEWLEQISRYCPKNGQPLTTWLDLQGSKMRLGYLAQARRLESGAMVTFQNELQSHAQEIPLPHPEVFEVIHPGARISIDDGRIQLQVESHRRDLIHARVLAPGEVQAYKGFVLSDTNFAPRAINARDQAIIEATRSYAWIGYAISYLQSPAELAEYQTLAANRPLVAKIERHQAFAHLQEIARAAAQVWLCRGDLGAELPIYELYRYEKIFFQQLQLQPKPFLIAGQVLENMVRQPNPSRSEVAHLGFLMEQGFSGLVLSDETAIGKFPLEAVAFCRDFFNYQQPRRPGHDSIPEA